MAPEFDPNRPQWLHISIQIDVNGAIDADMDEILEPLTSIWIEMWSHWRRFGSNSGAIDANMDQILEPLTPIWIEMWSHWRRFGLNSGAIDADMDQNVEPLTPSRLGLARKFKLGGLF